jgi:hypothetical protein
MRWGAQELTKKGTGQMPDLPAGKIKIERGSAGEHYALTMTSPDGSTVGVVINADPANRSALEYFFEKLAPVLSIWESDSLLRESKGTKVLVDSDSEAVFRLADGTTIGVSLELGRLHVVASHEGGSRPAIDFEKTHGNAGNLVVRLLPDAP